MTKTNQPFSIARYEAQVRRTKQRLAIKLLQLTYPLCAIATEGDDCLVEEPMVGTTRISNYSSRVCDYAPASAWERLAEKDRYQALHLLVPKEYHTPVPGGVVYQVRFANAKGHYPRVMIDEWVFLTVGHTIGRCKLVPQTLAARVF